MATIGLDKLHFAPITEAPTTGEETYGTPTLPRQSLLNFQLS